MAQSNAATVAQYISELPPERRKTIKSVRGMISYQIPLKRYPDTYNKQPLFYAALAAQKHFTGLYLMSVYNDENLNKRLLAGFKKAGLKPDMGKSCIRFKTIDQIPFEVIGEIIAATSVDDFIKEYEKTKRK
jgi:uncharacterized protein YdhG (YjbR/CyaY superfamily)